ncbi:hypothetical protein GXW74_15540 [Roseomonas eburnea]|uniref:DNA circulation N-terminal domain-containing protein n=1 Tax=Neoroseomonas eburnea TaxID=1346889 RepID=A0A9X9XDX1_9PROT|nr:DNA circularization N-terminal domain-containing protein [Neoroseomonas eburnea]MBR0681907.1 hypothetical protein [Neoroseomonas eburnea]
MSGALIPAGLLPAGLADLFEGLFGASWRGVSFHMPDARHEVGRRVVRIFFPGRDATAHEDLGAHDGTISVSGLILGDDYARRARAMEAAFREPGPGTLVHPWLGELEVVLARPATISFSERELRVARFEAQFEPWVERATAPLDTLGQVLAEIDSLKAEARALLRRVLAPLLLPLAAIGAVNSYANEARSLWTGLLSGGRGAGAILTLLPGTALPGLSAVGGLPIDEAYGDAVTDALQAVPDGISAAAVAGDAPAIGPAAEAASIGTVATVDPVAATDILLSALDGLGLSAANPAPGPALALVGRAQALAAAVGTATGISYETRQDAVAWRARIDGALAALAGSAASVASAASGGQTSAGPGAMWRAVTDLRAAWARDMNERIGRLPSLERIAPPRAVPLWLLAQHIAGADPGRVVSQYEDLVRRNRLRHPAILDAGVALDVLRQ